METSSHTESAAAGNAGQRLNRGTTVGGQLSQGDALLKQAIPRLSYFSKERRLPLWLNARARVWLEEEEWQQR